MASDYASYKLVNTLEGESIQALEVWGVPSYLDEQAIDALKEQIGVLEVQEAAIAEQIDDLTTLFQSRQRPLEDELQTVRSKKVKIDQEIQSAIKAAESDLPPPPGSESLAWVDSTLFGLVCNIIVALNLAVMFFGPRLRKQDGPLLVVLDYVFLSWYVTELTLKTLYHQQNLFIGRISVVWWNWLDLVIVIGGVADQWLMPIVMLLTSPGGGAVDSSFASVLRCLRLLRILRALKLLRAFFEGDMSWTESAPFEVFMSAVIALNAVVMSLELDFVWAGWPFVENAFMIIYFFELSVRLKKQGCGFFADTGNLVWNYLDFVMVVGGVLDLWLMPAIVAIQSSVNPGASDKPGLGQFKNVMALLRIVRIMRVLRLVRLLKAIKPLYRLMLGVVESLKAMQWVIVLTMLMLYGGAIFWTSLVGKGLIYGGEPPLDAVKSFGSVPRSLFSLFRLMNGDTDVVKSLTTTVVGQLLFAGFMVLANWAILAILTSVVSDNMISSSAKASEEDSQVEKAALHAQRMKRLRTLFREIDTDSSGTINEQEWHGLFKDAGLAHELSDATALSEKDLHDLFECMAVEANEAIKGKGGARAKQVSSKLIQYDAFIEHLRDETSPADKRSVLQLKAQLRHLEKNLAQRIEEIWDAVHPGSPYSPLPPSSPPSSFQRQPPSLATPTAQKNDWAKAYVAGSPQNYHSNVSTQDVAMRDLAADQRQQKRHGMEPPSAGYLAQQAVLHPSRGKYNAYRSLGPPSNSSSG
mmetsp:Transcript_51240/g.166106  ORF Transcript_51240/g.166106 Transcript_51240/m.166106 type:complete len:752 (-) Transcript_51240:287-2542(-)